MSLRILAFSVPVAALNLRELFIGAAIVAGFVATDAGAGEVAASVRREWVSFRFSGSGELRPDCRGGRV